MGLGLLLVLVFRPGLERHRGPGLRFFPEFLLDLVLAFECVEDLERRQGHEAGRVPGLLLGLEFLLEFRFQFGVRLASDQGNR